MSLYIRLFNSFWNHRKTIRLKSLLGNDAHWIPLRIWSYAAENQPDGDLSNYSDSELGLIIGYSGDASSMLQALHQAGFLKDKKIWNWEKWNGYHSTFAERARHAANVKHGNVSPKPPSDKKGKDKIRKETSSASSMLQASRRGLVAQRMARAQYEELHGNDAFKAFWELYPNKLARGDAIAAWNKINPSTETVRKIMEAVKAQAESASWKSEGGKFIPSPSKWLLGLRWEDKIKDFTKPQIHLRPAPTP